MHQHIEKLFRLTVEKGASDLHLGANRQPYLRINERLIPAEDDKLTTDVVKELIYSLLRPDQIQKFEANRELDIAFEIKDLSRFRVNIYYQRGYMGCAIRALPYKIMSFEECGLPLKIATEFCKRPKGLVLVTGATGSGKSTTLASMIDKINSERGCHIITIEDPIEYVHSNKKSIIEQREVFADTNSFAEALKHVLRQDPNVILIGEMRDLETVEAALVIAETGHLVFATLHTSDATQTINRIIDVFPAHQQQQVRIQLSFVLQGVLSQQLIPRADGKGRALACEVLVANSPIRSLIREMKTHQVYSVIQTGQKDGMKTMNQALYDLYASKAIALEEALSRTTDLEDFERLFKK